MKVFLSRQKTSHWGDIITCLLYTSCDIFAPGPVFFIGLETYSIDEQMTPFTGRCPFRQFVKNKPQPVGFKVFVTTASSGLVLDFEVYQGQTTELLNPELGLGPSVVMTLVRTLPHKVFYF